MKPLKIRLLLALTAFSLSASAQLYVGPGSIFHIAAGTPVNFDSLTIVPASGLTLSNVSISKSYIPVVVNSISGINRVYTFSTPITLDGEIGLFTQASELNGNSLSGLKILYDAASAYHVAAGSIVNPADYYVYHNLVNPVSVTTISAIDSSAVLQVSGTSLDTVSFLAYPNPTSGTLYFRLSGKISFPAYISVMNRNGQLLIHQRLTTQSGFLELHNLASGVYLLQYNDAKNNFVRKINKQ